MQFIRDFRRLGWFAVLLGLVAGNAFGDTYSYRWLGTTSSDPFTTSNWNPSIDLTKTTGQSLGIDDGTTNFNLSTGTINCYRLEVNGAGTIATISGGTVINTGTCVHVGHTSKTTGTTITIDNAPTLEFKSGIITNRDSQAVDVNSGVYLGFKTPAILNMYDGATIDLQATGRFFLSAAGGTTIFNQNGGTVNSETTIHLDDHSVSDTDDGNKATWNLKGGTLTAPLLIQKGGELNVSGGSYTGQISTDGNAVLTISAGSVTHTGTNSPSFKSLTLSGGTLNAAKITMANNGTLTYTGGTLNVPYITGNVNATSLKLLNDENRYISANLTVNEIQLGNADFSGNPSLSIWELVSKATTSTLKMYSGTLRCGDMVGELGKPFVLTLKGGTIQAGQWSGNLVNDGVDIQIADSRLSDYSTIGTMTFRNTAGALTMKAGTITFDLTTDGKCDALNLYRIRPNTTEYAANGNVTLTGGKFIVNTPSTAPAENTQYSIIQNAASFTRGTSTFTDSTSGITLTVKTGTGFQLSQTNNKENWAFTISEHTAGTTTNKYYSGELTYTGQMTETTYNASTSTWSAGNPLGKPAGTAGLYGVLSGSGVKLQAENQVLTDSKLTVKNGATLQVSGKRLYVNADNSVSAALYLEEGGTISVDQNCTFGPTSADAMFVMTGGTVTGANYNSGLRVDYGSAIISGGTFTNGLLHLGTSSDVNPAYVRVEGNADVHLNSCPIGWNGGTGSLLEITGGTFSVRGTSNGNDYQNHCFAIPYIGNSSASSTVKISGGTVMAEQLKLGTSGTGVLTQSGGSLAVNKFTLGSKGTFNLIGGTFAAQTYTGNLVNNGATVRAAGTYETVNSDDSVKTATFDSMTISGKYTQAAGTLEIVIDGGDISSFNANVFDITGGTLLFDVVNQPTEHTVYKDFLTAKTITNLNFDETLFTAGLPSQWQFDASTRSLTYFTSNEIPEPASWILLALGLGLLGIRGRR